MNDCPRRYTQKKAAYRSVSSLHKTRFGGFLLIWPVKGIEVAEDASVTIRQLIDSRGDIILFVFCDEKHKTLWIALFLVEVKSNRFLSQNYILKNSKKAV
ncbi:hypothetical protein LJ009_001388 [Salmonella enterica subsp. enterica serovar Enteritidis]|nr:hypothetical protein [Salmonella enterica subsp. enterica serovar Enteritidis]EIK2817113.1 hypothetical protein [Salmonella enterica subsp. enterica serovar Enteritidis]